VSPTEVSSLSTQISSLKATLNCNSKKFVFIIEQDISLRFMGRRGSEVVHLQFVWAFGLVMMIISVASAFRFTGSLISTSKRSIYFLRSSFLRDMNGPMGLGRQTPKLPLVELANQQRLRSLIEEYKESKERKVFDERLQFPTEFLIKIVGTNDPTFVSDMLNTLATCTNSPVNQLNYLLKNSSGASNYVSISVAPLFQDSTQLYTAYDVISKDSRVKFML